MSKNKFVKPNQDYMPEGDSNLLQKDIEELGLSEYTLSKLKSVEICKIIDLARCQMKHLYKIPGMNKKNIFEVLKKLQNAGLDLKRSPVLATVAEEGLHSKNDAKDNSESVKVTGNQDKKADNKKNKDNKKENIAKNKGKGQPVVAENNTAEIGAKQNNKNFDKKNKQDKKNNSDIKQNQNNDNKVAFGNKKQAIPQKQVKVGNPNPINNSPQKPQAEPKRMKVNSYDIDSFINENTSGKKTLKQEREEKIAKAIKDLPPVKNADGLYKFYRHGKWGYKTESGKVVIEPTYTEAFNFREGLACVELDERCGFINKQGEIVIPIQYDTACSFSEGVASVTKGDKCGYIDKEGNIVFDFVYEAATSFENDIALVKKDGKWGYMDRKTGEIRLR